MNQVQRGYFRDNAIVETLDEWKVMDSQLITRLFFNFPSGLRKCQERLYKLYKAEKIERWENHGAYVYGYKTALWQHTLLLNWVRLNLEAQAYSWEKVWSFTYEFNTPILRTDALMAIKNMFEGTFRFCFVEMERATNDRNKFDKVAKYNKLFEAVNDGGVNFWWVPLTKRFPIIILIAETPSRKRLIDQSINDENAHGLEFDVRLFEDVRREVLNSDMGGSRC